MLSLVRTLFFSFFLWHSTSALDVAFNDAFRRSIPNGTVQIVGVGDTVTRNFSVTPQYFPVNSKRDVGQVISFKFFSNSSQLFSVTEGTFEQPCIPKPGGFSSGIIHNPKDAGLPVGDFYFFNFTVLTLEPFYFFANTEACTFGMAGGINTPDAPIFREKSIALVDNPPAGLTSPPSTTSAALAQATSSEAPDSSGQNITLVLVATPLGIAGILFGIFGVITYVRRLRRAQAREIEAIDQESGRDMEKTLELESVEQQPIEMGMKSPSIFELWGDTAMKHISVIRPSRLSNPPKVPSKDKWPSSPKRVHLQDEPMAKEETEKKEMKSSTKVGIRFSLKRSKSSAAQIIPNLGFRSPSLMRPASTSGWVRNPGLRSPGVPKVSSLTGLP